MSAPAAVQREWFSAAELAGIPGMPAVKRSVLLQADAAGWRFREAVGRGGTRREFHITSLPAQTRAALIWERANVLAGGSAIGADTVAAQAQATAAQLGMAQAQRDQAVANLQARAQELAQADGLRAAMALSHREQARMDARLAVLRQVEAFRAASGLVITTAEHQFVAAWRAGQVNVPESVRTEIGPNLSASSLQRWRLALQKGGISRLGGDYGNRKGATKVDEAPELRAFVEAMLVNHPDARATQIMRGLKARLASQVDSGELALPSLRSLERWMGQWRAKHKEVVAALSAPDHYKNKFMVAFGSQSEGVDRINQRWEMDSTPADVMLLDGRYTVLGVIDVYTRRVRLIVSKSSKSVAVCALLRGTLLAWGVPEEVKTDNGSDYVSKHTTRALDGLGVKQTLCPPFQPWHKPHIERFFGTYSRSLMELLPGFIGHNVAERKHIEERKSFADRLMTRGECVEVRMSAHDFQAFCDRWVNDLYHHDQHSGLGSSTPFEVAAAAQDTLRVIKDERVLDVLLAEAPDRGGLRTVQKKGIKHDGAYFIAPELEAHVGRNVTVRFDALDNDLGKLYVFGDEGFICVAECPERTGMDRREVATKAKAMQTARVQAERAALKKAAKRVGTDTVVEEILTTRAQAAGKLARLPARSTEYTAPGIEQAALAVAAATATPGSSADVLTLDGVGAAWQRLQAAAAAQDAPAGTDNELARRRTSNGITAPQFESRHQRAQWLLQQQHTRALTPEEGGYLLAYKQDHAASYRRMQEAATHLLGGANGNDPGRSNGTGSV